MNTFLFNSVFSLSVLMAVAHEHLKERGLFGLPPPPPGATPADYYHLMTGHRNPYGELLMQGAGAAAAAAHLPEYFTPVDGEFRDTQTRVRLYNCAKMHEICCALRIHVCFQDCTYVCLQRSF
ncbi:hypothetical protein M9458_023001 [Cirrhinus mrigala]|uniref:Uncharacterized protein n=1 Tax=Cirrhinus mrigala TaxID=683832 RepID=A0ABD0Q3W1_CIRMR